MHLKLQASNKREKRNRINLSFVHAVAEHGLIIEREIEPKIRKSTVASYLLVERE